jgi:hypothetical protein
MYRLRINDHVSPELWTFLEVLKLMRALPYDSKVDPSNRMKVEVLLLNGEVHYTDRRI